MKGSFMNIKNAGFSPIKTTRLIRDLLDMPQDRNFVFFTLNDFKNTQLKRVIEDIPVGTHLWISAPTTRQDPKVNENLPNLFVKSEYLGKGMFNVTEARYVRLGKYLLKDLLNEIKSKTK